MAVRMSYLTCDMIRDSYVIFYEQISTQISPLFFVSFFGIATPRIVAV
jgi:hypothetical protein